VTTGITSGPRRPVLCHVIESTNETMRQNWRI